MINYVLLTKPGIIMGNLVTLAAGFLLGAKGEFDFSLFLCTFVGLAFIMASACVANNYLDRPLDAKMKRTQNRPLVKGLISSKHAILFAIAMGVSGFLVLMLATNFLAVCAAAVGYFVYVVLYSIWKSRTIYGTAIGSIAGATPPVVGYLAASHQMDIGALILFVMLVLWQMPHFFAIALMHLDDYAVAKIPVLPLVKGVKETKIRMAFYILCFMLAAALLTAFDYMGYTYLLVAVVASLLWLTWCLLGFKQTDHERWGRAMFRLSLAIIASICLAIPFDMI